MNAQTIRTWKRCWSLNMRTNDHDLNQSGSHDPKAQKSDSPGYEVTDGQR